MTPSPTLPLSPSPTPLPARLASIDTYRGFVMFLMMAEILRLSAVAAKFPDSSFWKFLAYHQSHVIWAGCSLHDLIQPSFSFLVGVSLPFSIASRVAKGQSRGQMIAHAVWRALLLVLLGVFLRSMSAKQTNWTFEDTLSQIGFGYVPLFLLGFTCRRWQWAAFVTILLGYWAAFALYPLPSADFDYQAVGVPADFPHYTGFMAHWNKNSNLAWAFDTWFLNLFPRPSPFLFNRGGYATLSFIPTLGTMILGLIAGGWLKGQSPVDSISPLRVPHSALRAELTTASTLRAPSSALRALLFTGLLLLALGLAAHLLGLCPNVKRIWTPAWTLFSGGWCFLFLAAFYYLLDTPDSLLRAPHSALRAASFPFRVIGANSIAAYILAHGPDKFLADSLKIHFGTAWAEKLGPAYSPLLLGAAILFLEWLILLWLYRQKIHIRI
jgi:heparan-alpha-glucosaminide N-acetyltransferase